MNERKNAVTKMSNFENLEDDTKIIQQENNCEVDPSEIELFDYTGNEEDLYDFSEGDEDVSNTETELVDQLKEEIKREEEAKKNEKASEEDSKKEEKEKVEVKFSDCFDRTFNKNTVKKYPITSREEATNLVRQYYAIQKLRIGSNNRQYQLDQKASNNSNSKEENISFAYAKAGLKETEDVITMWLKEYAKNDPIGRWLLSVKGIGPVLAAGLISYIDISKCQTAGAIWKYAGWEGHRPPKKKGVKLDYNPHFRVLCWKIGESFQKVSGYKTVELKDENGKKYKETVRDENGNPIDRYPDALYGHLYREKLKIYIAKNEAGGFKAAADLALSEKNFEKESTTKACYESGKLPMAHLIAMAKRYAVKIFLSNLFELWYEYENGCKAPRPFVEVYCGHVHMIEPPNKEILFKE